MDIEGDKSLEMVYMTLVYIEIKQVANSNKAVTEQTIYIRPE